MALITCKDCDNQISTEAKACPHCGRPTSRSFWARKRVERKYTGPGCMIQIIGLVLSVVLMNPLPFIIGMVIGLIALAKSRDAVKNMDLPDK